MTAQAINGVLITHADAAELVQAIDDLARITWQRGRRLPYTLGALRQKLAQCATCADAYADTSVEVPAAVDDADSHTGVVDTATAARKLEMTEAGVRYLCSNKRLAAMRVNGRWWIATASINDYAGGKRSKESAVNA